MLFTPPVFALETLLAVLAAIVLASLVGTVPAANHSAVAIDIGLLMLGVAFATLPGRELHRAADRGQHSWRS